MSYLSVKLPITKDDVSGFAMLDNFQDLIRQNLKMLILTSKGERIMEPEFGVGIRNYLFENFNNSTFQNIDTNIREQVELFTPALRIIEILFDSSDVDNNKLGIAIFYRVPEIGFKDLLEFTI